MNFMTKRDYDPDSAQARACRSQPVGTHTLASSPTNPRKTFNATQMAELVQSVKEHGILTPILVRCWPANQAYTGNFPMYEVVAGERRFRAAKAAGLALMPALIRDLTDAQVLEIQVIENLQRADLHPLEEADGYSHMMTAHGYTAEQIAEKIGKSRSYIFGRLKLLALDRFDVLDMKGREDLLYWLDGMAADGEIDTAIIFGTLKGLPALNLDSVEAFWIDNGTTGQLKEAA